MPQKTIRNRLSAETGVSGAVTILIVINSVIELVLMAADRGLIGSRYWRSLAYDNGAFFSHLLGDWQPNFSLQPVTMFFTYSFLHSGFPHLALNMITLAFFGSAIAKQGGTLKFLLAYMLSAVGGGLGFGLLSNSSAPMVGASGALFGLLGVWICWGYLERRHYGEGLGSVYKAVAILFLYNLASWALLPVQIAWETHLGGFVAGWLIALVWGRPIYQRRRRTRGG